MVLRYLLRVVLLQHGVHGDTKYELNQSRFAGNSARLLSETVWHPIRPFRARRKNLMTISSDFCFTRKPTEYLRQFMSQEVLCVQNVDLPIPNPEIQC